MRISTSGLAAAGSSHHAEQPQHEHDHHDASNGDGKVHKTSSSLAGRNLELGLAERGQRREEGRPLGWIRLGLDSCVDPDSLTLHPLFYSDHDNSVRLVLQRTANAIWE
jgi:hypothetical protein